MSDSDEALWQSADQKPADKVNGADGGLVHAISNWQEGADTICNCCNCCCLFMDAYHVLKHHKSHDVSNYRVRTNPGTCKACSLCVKCCPMNALQLKTSTHATNKFHKVVVDEDLCIGCGVCVYKCPTESLILERREETYAPPQVMRVNGWSGGERTARPHQA